MAPARLTGPSLGQRISAVGAWPDADSAEAHTRAEKVHILYRQGPPAQLIGILGATVICWVLWDVSDHTRLGMWWILLTAVIVGRIILAVRFQRHDPLPMEMAWWERAFVFSLGAVGLVWGLGGWLIMPADSALHQAVVFFFLMGVAGAVVAAYAAHAVAAITAVLAIMLPPTVAFAITGTFETRVMAAGGVLYLAASLRSTRTFAVVLRRTFDLSFELREAYARVREQARTDDLTKLPNRRAFVALGRAAVDQAKRYGRPLSLMMMDVDHFKRINDTYGHAAGDAALCAVADALRAVCRSADTPGRLGGEEFAVLLPETSGERASVVAERLRADIESMSVDHEGAEFRFTCSVGLAEHSDNRATIDRLLSAADGALYKAKEQGRNRVVHDGQGG